MLSLINTNKLDFLYIKKTIPSKITH